MGAPVGAFGGAATFTQVLVTWGNVGAPSMAVTQAQKGLLSVLSLLPASPRQPRPLQEQPVFDPS